MQITISPAASGDLPALDALYAAVCDYLRDKPFNPGGRRGSFPTAEEARIHLQEGAVLLARCGGTLAGSVGLSPNPDGEAPAQGPLDPETFYIHVLAVHPDFLRRGVAGQLLAAAGDCARKAGGRRLRLYVWEGNQVAIRTYEKSGFACLRQGVDIGLGEFGLDRFSLYEKNLCF